MTSSTEAASRHWDVVVVGSGFGGATAALQLAEAGKSVLIVDRGRAVDRDATAWDTKSILIDQKYRDDESRYEAPQFPRRRFLTPNASIGGSSVFYGAASFRFREADFQRRSRYEHVYPVEPGYVDWPIGYRELAPYYNRAEELLGVVGDDRADPTAPPRSVPYRGQPPEYGSPAKRIVDAAESLGLHPFKLPLAINFNGTTGRNTCERCMTCDLYPCKLEAKNDLTVTVLPRATAAGATVLGRVSASRLIRDRDRIVAVECADADTGEPLTFSCDLAVISGGAIPTPRLLLASGLGEVGPNGKLIGRYLMRHCSGIAMGLFRDHTNPEQRFHKQVAITDFYFGSPDGRRPVGPWGMIQGLQVPPPEYIELGAPYPINKIGAATVAHHLYLLCIAEDVPQYDNRVELHRHSHDKFGQPVANLVHRYSRRDRQGRKALYREAIRILQRARASVRLRKPINSFSHAVGTCRFGTDPETAVLDPYCNFFGIPNLFVVDGSILPTAGATNPSLTIAANGLRVGEHIARNWSTHANCAP